MHAKMDSQFLYLTYLRLYKNKIDLPGVPESQFVNCKTYLFDEMPWSLPDLKPAEILKRAFRAPPRELKLDSERVCEPEAGQ